jgi:hypothetical protein
MPPIVNDQRETERARQVDGFLQRARQAALRHVEADLAHRVLEQLAILGHFDCRDRRADQLDAVLLERAILCEIDCEIQRGLAADGRQQRVRPLPRDDRREHFRRQRLDVRARGQLRVGHDRRRVAVDEDHVQPLGAQRLARLCSRVVELARLADDDRTGADDENPFQISAAGHLFQRLEAGGWRLGRARRPNPMPSLEPLASSLLDEIDEVVEQIVRIVRAG